MPDSLLTSFPDPDWIIPLASAVAVILVLAIPVWLIIRWYIKPTNAEERKDAITLLFQTLGGVAFLLGVFFTWQQLINSREELKTSREGQITERYTRAIDQLGKTEDETKDRTGKNSGTEQQRFLAIRLGGIYALERIAKDSDRDHATIMEVLTAFVRQHSSWIVGGGNSSDSIIKPDIQAVLTVIGRRGQTYGHGESQRLDLSGTDLRGVLLNDANLDGAILRSAHFEGSTTNLKGIQLNNAILQDARFGEAILDGAQLRGADLRGASFQGTSVVRQTDHNLLLAARARFTFSRMSEALAVQTNGFGSVLCWAM